MLARVIASLGCVLLVFVSRQAFAAPAPHAMVGVTLDGTSLGTIGIARPGEPSLVAVERVAMALGWQSTVLTAALRLIGEDRTVTITAGSHTIRENGDLHFAFLEPVLVRGGHWYVRASDASRLFGLVVRAGSGKTIAFARPEQVGSNVRVRDIARPSVPKALATPRSSARATATNAMQNAPAGRIMVSFERTGGSQFFQFSSQTQGAGFQTSLTATGSTTLDTPYATVLVGTAARNTTLGMQTDPLNGTIFRGALYEGVSYNRTDRLRSIFAGRRLDTGTDMIGETSGDPFHGGATTVAFLARDGRYEETIVRRVTRIHESWGDFSTETVGGDRGAAIGLGARTRGRTFLEAQASYASHGLPLGPNDAPISIDLGRTISPALTVAGGFATGPQQPLSPFFGLYTHAGAFSGTFSVTNRTLTAGGGYQSSLGSIQAYVVPGAQRFAGVSGLLYLPVATVELASTSNMGTRDSSLLARSLRHGLNIVAGVGLPAGGHLGPIAGLAFPIARLVSLEGTVRPAAGGRSALRMSLAMGIPGRRTRSEPTVKTLVRIAGSGTQLLRLFVDGIPIRRFSPPETRVDVTRGAHVYAVETDDGTLGSLDRPVAADAVGTPIELTLLPVRTIRGRVVLPENSGLPADFNRAGMVIVLEPGHVSVETAADGTFFFPPMPIGPDATIAVDPAVLPREVRAPEAQPIGAGDILFVLQPAARVERTVFPDSHETIVRRRAFP